MNRGIAHLVAGTVLSFVIFILPPVSVHAPNAAEFTEPALLLLLPFIGLFLVGALLAGLISRLTSYPPALLGHLSLLLRNEPDRHPDILVVGRDRDRRRIS